MTALPDNPISNKESTLELSKVTRDLTLSHKKLESAKDKLNLYEVNSAIQSLQQGYQEIEQTWRGFIEQQKAVFVELQKQISDPEYPAKLESALRDREVPFSGSFPNYDIPPLKLSIDITRCTARLNMGKKSQQSKNLAPQLIADWVDMEIPAFYGNKLLDKLRYLQLALRQRCSVIHWSYDFLPEALVP